MACIRRHVALILIPFDCVTSTSCLMMHAIPQVLLPVLTSEIHHWECKRNVEYCLGLKQNVTYARAAAQQDPGIALGNLNGMFGVRRNVWNVTYARMDQSTCCSCLLLAVCRYTDVSAPLLLFYSQSCRQIRAQHHFIFNSNIGIYF